MVNPGRLFYYCKETGETLPYRGQSGTRLYVPVKHPIPLKLRGDVDLSANPYPPEKVFTLMELIDG